MVTNSMKTFKMKKRNTWKTSSWRLPTPPPTGCSWRLLPLQSSFRILHRHDSRNEANNIQLGDNSHMLKIVAQEDRRSLVLNMWLGSCTTPAQPRKLLVMWAICYWSRTVFHSQLNEILGDRVLMKLWEFQSLLVFCLDALITFMSMWYIAAAAAATSL